MSNNPVDPKSNKGPSSKPKEIGVIKGRYKFSKQPVGGLNKGVVTPREK